MFDLVIKDIKIILLWTSNLKMLFVITLWSKSVQNINITSVDIR